jgi:phosphatidylserine/phosphatidylglycerophosphate/cardiolipin synthase-like enzyme
VQDYSFTSEPIARALSRANKRCHKVVVILDKSQLTAKNTMLPLIGKAGIETYIDKQHAIAHEKAMVIDGHIVITGNFNVSSSEEYFNAEDIIIVDSRELAKQHYDNFIAHKNHSVRYNY